MIDDVRLLSARACFGVAAMIAFGVAATASAANAQTSGQAAPAAASLFTSDQATRGEAEYEHYCRDCHGAHLDDGDFGGPPLRGSYFHSHWGASDVATLFSFTKTTMPPDNPGSLSDASYADILAYVLQYNGYKSGDSELPTDPGAQSALKLGAPANRRLKSRAMSPPYTANLRLLTCCS
jgi:mono/diheme cytochrome c family protein